MPGAGVRTAAATFRVAADGFRGLVEGVPGVVVLRGLDVAGAFAALRGDPVDRAVVAFLAAGELVAFFAAAELVAVFAAGVDACAFPEDACAFAVAERRRGPSEPDPVDPAELSSTIAPSSAARLRIVHQRHAGRGEFFVNGSLTRGEMRVDRRDRTS